jgi:hypothetical protein
MSGMAPSRAIQGACFLMTATGLDRPGLHAEVFSPSAIWADGRPSTRGRFFFNTNFSPGGAGWGNHFPFARFFLEWAPGRSNTYVGPMIKTWEPYVHAAMFTVAVPTIIAVIV